MVINHPRNKPWVGNGGAENLANSETFICGDDGIIVLRDLGKGIFAIHVAFLPKTKGTGYFTEIVNTLDHKVIMAQIPARNRHTRMSAKRHGFKELGSVPSGSDSIILYGRVK